MVINNIKKTVVYTVQIESANEGAWYRTMKNHKYDAILEIEDKPFGGQEIVFRVLGSYKPVKYIQLHHCIVKRQRIATHTEVTSYYKK